MGSERRKHSRHATAWPVVVNTDEWSMEGRVNNISLGGALIFCKELPDMSGLIRLEIQIPEHHYAIAPTARVIHFDVAEIGGSLAYRFGVSFEEISSKDRVLLNNAILALSRKQPAEKDVPG
jgi:hypothetical protein